VTHISIKKKVFSKVMDSWQEQMAGALKDRWVPML
jgi:hypothetical protein